ncbi:MAG TPA: hypothetical protein VGP05_10675, partial [Pseudonocardia sp.]|nr:hypothetical protein [Pseudonocardia sp.]
MSWPGHSRGVPVTAGRGDLAGRAALIGGVLAVAASLSVVLAAVFGGSAGGVQPVAEPGTLPSSAVAERTASGRLDDSGSGSGDSGSGDSGSGDSGSGDSGEGGGTGTGARAGAGAGAQATRDPADREWESGWDPGTRSNDGSNGGSNGGSNDGSGEHRGGPDDQPVP